MYHADKRPVYWFNLFSTFEQLLFHKCHNHLDSLVSMALNKATGVNGSGEFITLEYRGKVREFIRSIYVGTLALNVLRSPTIRGTHGLKSNRLNHTNRPFWQVDLAKQPNSYLARHYLHYRVLTKKRLVIWCPW